MRSLEGPSTELPSQKKPQHNHRAPVLQIPEESLPEASPARITLEDCEASLLHGELLDREIKPGAPVAAQNAGDVYGSFSTDNAPSRTSVSAINRTVPCHPLPVRLD